MRRGDILSRRRVGAYRGKPPVRQSLRLTGSIHDGLGYRACRLPRDVRASLMIPALALAFTTGLTETSRLTVDR